MSKCRICLESKRSLCSIFETDQGLSYALMITLLTGIKIIKDDNGRLCLLCRRKLKDFYNFKLLIERSELVLNKHANIFRFNTVDEIKLEFSHEINRNSKKKDGNIASNYNYLLQNGHDCINYNNTLIRRLNQYEKKILPIEEILNTLKFEEDAEDDYLEDYINTADDYNYKEKKTESKITQKHHASNMTKISKAVSNVRIRPVFLSDIKVLKTNTKSVLKRIKTYPRRKKDGTLCPFCGKMAKSIKTHILIHSGERKFKCNKCSKSFYTKQYLEYHMKSHTTMKQSFKCDHCILNFSSKGAVSRHMATHMEFKQFSCAICTKEFKWKSALRRHMLIHNMAAKSIQCDICSMSFYSRGSLKSHTRVHTGERPYKCELCSQPYSYKRDFNRHCLKKHGVIIDRRSVHLMNEEVLKREKALMKDIMLRLHGIPTDTEPMDAFHGPQKALAFAKAVTVMQNGQIPIDVHL